MFLEGTGTPQQAVADTKIIGEVLWVLNDSSSEV
jgi:hypothetical protein